MKSWSKADTPDRFNSNAPKRIRHYTLSLDSLDPCEIPESHHIKLSKDRGVVLFISSISMVTNRFGDFSKCLIISSIFGDRDVTKVASKAKAVWRKFAHHPQTARCLVFLLVLGALCRKMAKEYDTSVGYVDEFKAKDDAAASLAMLKSDPELKAIYNADGKLMSGVLRDRDGDVATYWLRGTKRSALYRMRTALNECVTCSLQAKQELEQQMQEYSKSHHLSPGLENLCQWYLGTFDKDHTRLTVVSARLEGLMESIDRSMEVFSNVATMVDSKTALNQSKTIQKLTYLTIAYLPLGLLTAIFAIPKEQDTVAETMGLAWYVGGLLIMFSVTTVTAIYIDELLSSIQNFPRKTVKMVKGLRKEEGGLPK
ncbi:hypothetical protein B0T16DRAFT_236584 [Cercophora newfieldiana]|uniref:Uncharacterized protein n=1 Tax=Cercophora newfieldiana TaxID=92897 RepID=A0AA40CIU4_9PEZI|nr:hypothetical protein B0T16DRAFT_236584 [Cercophora newfieldiana]